MNHKLVDLVKKKNLILNSQLTKFSPKHMNRRRVLVAWIHNLDRNDHSECWPCYRQSMMSQSIKIIRNKNPVNSLFISEDHFHLLSIEYWPTVSCIFYFCKCETFLTLQVCFSHTIMALMHHLSSSLTFLFFSSRRTAKQSPTSLPWSPVPICKD